ncbi:MAG: hypothetical protein LBR55_07715 [Bacteroidales bacterium]|jgi:hypothetical protein|nr:hypothetical protein [Bacteroidales bacterium]
MFSRINIFEICKDGANAIRGESKKITFFLIYWFVPIVFATILWHFDYCISKDISSDIVGGIGLFAGLMFTLLFVVTNSYRTRKEQLSYSKNEEDKKYLERYNAFTQSTVSLISYSIVKAGLIILFTLAYVSLLTYKCNNLLIVFAKLCNGLLVIQLTQFAIVITMILKEMYAMLYDDINK